MEIKSESFKIASSKIFNGILIALIAAIAAGIIAIIGVITAALTGSLTSLGILSIIAGVMGLVGVYGYFVQYQGACELEKAVDTEDAPHIAKFKLALLLLLIGIGISSLLSFFPIIGLAGSIMSGLLGIGGSILSLMAFNALKTSASFPEKEGATKLWTAYLLYVIAYGCMISLILAWAAPILNLIGFIFALIGWSKMKK